MALLSGLPKVLPSCQVSLILSDLSHLDSWVRFCQPLDSGACVMPYITWWCYNLKATSGAWCLPGSTKCCEQSVVFFSLYSGLSFLTSFTTSFLLTSSRRILALKWLDLFPQGRMVHGTQAHSHEGKEAGWRPAWAIRKKFCLKKKRKKETIRL